VLGLVGTIWFCFSIGKFIKKFIHDNLCEAQTQSFMLFVECYSNQFLC
jgi:hypothetical protein